MPGNGSRYVRDALGIDTVIVGGAVAWSARNGYSDAARGAILPGAIAGPSDGSAGGNTAVA